MTSFFFVPCICAVKTLRRSLTISTFSHDNVSFHSPTWRSRSTRDIAGRLANCKTNSFTSSQVSCVPFILAGFIFTTTVEPTGFPPISRLICDRFLWGNGGLSKVLLFQAHDTHAVVQVFNQSDSPTHSVSLPFGCKPGNKFFHHPKARRLPLSRLTEVSPVTVV